MEAMRRQLRNMNDEISDSDMVKLILQGVAFEYRGVVRLFDKDVRDGNVPLLSEVLNTPRSEAEIDKQRHDIGKKASSRSDETKILQVQQQRQFSGAKGKRPWKQNNANKKKKFKGNDGQTEEEARTCFFCHQPGHLKRDCTEYLEKQRQKKVQKNDAASAKPAGKKIVSFVRWSGAAGGKQSSIGMVEVKGAGCDGHNGQETLTAAVHSCDVNYDEWMVDTGAGVYVCTDWEAFSNLQEDSLTFVGWRGDTSKGEAFGQVNIYAVDAVSGGLVTLELQEARYASGGPTNLLSLECLELDGWVPSYSKADDPAQRVMYLERDGVRLEMPKRNGHYWLRTKRAAVDNVDMCMVTTTQKQSLLTQWHMRFAHLNAQAMKRLVLKDMVDGMKSLRLKDFDGPLDCIACTTAKQKRRSYRRHNKRSKVCYERLMSGVCRIGVETIGGNMYFQLIQDKASRYKWCYLLRHKSESTPNVKNLIMELEKEHNTKWFSSDRGGELFHKKMKRFLADHGVKLWKTDAYTPEENCLVEKLNGTLMNKVRAICEATGLPDSVWGEVLVYVVEVDNMTPTKALAGMTPYEKLTGTKPDVSNLHVCGCVAFAHVPKKKRASKLSPKAKPTLFLGYAQTSLGYRLLDLRTGNLIEQRDVSFREDITVDSVYVERLLARRYEGSEEGLPVRVPYVRLPVNAVLDTVHIPTRPSDEDSEDDDMDSVDGDSMVTTRKRRREDSSDSSDECLDDVDFSGSLDIDWGFSYKCVSCWWICYK
ncbi:hypothetical protein PR002_g14521 [Phytophthora rubi]|uniref:Integrase catalytic domain-containing protein n=1 Tax=Phytophthora rubi TaxID=129364 RepID=A0A6A3L5Z7_9STRA|nr:hypothetical protein PR002_g14518 [Phytophthora rubi]KAE9013388.1 hypothetical protein PR002_g14521 [Phytophthora rubi]